MAHTLQVFEGTTNLVEFQGTARFPSLREASNRKVQESSTLRLSAMKQGESERENYHYGLGEVLRVEILGNLQQGPVLQSEPQYKSLQDYPPVS